MSKISYKVLPKYKYELTKQYRIRLNLGERGFYSQYFSYRPENYTLTITIGYRWDGPSGPTRDTDNFMQGSLAHDALYQAMRERHLPLQYRKFADKVLYRLCREDGMSRTRANYIYYALRMGGRRAALPDGSGG